MLSSCGPHGPHRYPHEGCRSWAVGGLRPEPATYLSSLAEGTNVNVWATLERVRAITDAVERRNRSDGLVEEITDALATSGGYETRVDVMPTQQVVDFNWAAHQAGRRLGIRVHVEVAYGAVAADGHARARVTAQPPPA